MNIADTVGQPDPSEAAELEDLARRAAAGRPEVLDELLARIRPQVRRICGRMLINPDDAEEATQDALLRVATKIDTFDGRSRFTTWLHVVASNSARSTYRSLKRRASEHGVEHLPQTADPRTTSVIAGSRLDLLEALETLSARHAEMAQALVLRDVQELDYNEIAAQMGVPVGTVKSWVHRARQTVQPLLRVDG